MNTNVLAHSFYYFREDLEHYELVDLSESDEEVVIGYEGPPDSSICRIRAKVLHLPHLKCCEIYPEREESNV